MKKLLLLSLLSIVSFGTALSLSEQAPQKYKRSGIERIEKILATATFAGYASTIINNNGRGWLVATVSQALGIIASAAVLLRGRQNKKAFIARVLPDVLPLMILADAFMRDVKEEQKNTLGLSFVSGACLSLLRSVYDLYDVARYDF